MIMPTTVYLCLTFDVHCCTAAAPDHLPLRFSYCQSCDGILPKMHVFPGTSQALPPNLPDNRVCTHPKDALLPKLRISWIASYMPDPCSEKTSVLYLVVTFL